MDEEAKRQVLRRIPYGMFVMTATAGGNPAASTLTWISQCSFHPPLVVIGVQRNSLTHAAIEASGALAVNFLAHDQREIAEKFFRPPDDAGSGRLHGMAYESGPETGSPLLTDLPAWIEARVTDRVERGDHTVYVCEVVGAGRRESTFQPLLLASTSWNYGG